MRPAALACLLLVVNAGCTSGGGSNTPQPNRNPVVMIDEGGRVMRSSQLGTVANFEAPVDSLWNAVLAAYSDLAMEANTVDRAALTIGRNRLLIRRTFNQVRSSRFFSCGDDLVSGPNADNGEITANVVSQLEERGSDSAIATTVTATIRLYTGTSGGPIRCGSTGEIEERLRKAIEKRLRHEAE